jgi:hypothetical protein
VKRLLPYKPAAQRELSHMDRIEAERIMRALESFAAADRGERHRQPRPGVLIVRNSQDLSCRPQTPSPLFLHAKLVSSAQRSYGLPSAGRQFRIEGGIA